MKLKLQPLNYTVRFNPKRNLLAHRFPSGRGKNVVDFLRAAQVKGSFNKPLSFSNLQLDNSICPNLISEIHQRFAKINPYLLFLY